MIKSDIEPTEVLAEPPLPTPPAAQPADAEQQADQVVPQQADQVVPQQADQVVPQQAVHAGRYCFSTVRWPEDFPSTKNGQCR